MGNKIIDELRQIRDMPEKISWEYIQFFKQGVSRQSKAMREFKPQPNKSNKHSYSGITIFLEYKLEETPISELIGDT